MGSSPIVGTSRVRFTSDVESNTWADRSVPVDTVDDGPGGARNRRDFRRVGTNQMCDCMKREEMEPKSLMIGVLAVAVAILDFLYWESQQSRVEINVPGVSIKAK